MTVIYRGQVKSFYEVMPLRFLFRVLISFLFWVLGIYTLLLVHDGFHQTRRENIKQRKNIWMSVVDTDIEFSCDNINEINVVMFLGGGAWMNVYLGIYKQMNILVLKTKRNYQVLIIKLRTGIKQ